MERERYDAVVETHSAKVFTFASYLLGDATEAQDVAQEVLIKLWTHMESIQPDRIGSWLLTVTRNACTDVIRKRVRDARVVPIRPILAETPDPPTRDRSR